MDGMDTIIVKKEGPRATVTIDRPDSLNSLDRRAVYDLLDRLKDISCSNDIHILVIEGGGDNFSVGADFSLLSENMKSPEFYSFMKDVNEIIITLRTMRQTVICKVKGNAYGFGFGIALAADFTISALNARFCEAFVNLALTLDGGASYFLPRLVGPARAREIALLGGVIDGRTAASLGLIYRAVPSDLIDKEVQDLANKLMGKSKRALASIKSVLEDSFSKSLYQALETEATHQSILFESAEHKEALERLKNRTR